VYSATEREFAAFLSSGDGSPGGTWTDTFPDGTIRKTSCHIISSSAGFSRLVESHTAALKGEKVDTQTMTVMFFFTNEIIRKGVRPKKEEERVRCT
jgi:hypothetical protein